MDKNERLVLAISGKGAYRYMKQMSQWEYLYLPSRIIWIDKNHTIISELSFANSNVHQLEEDIEYNGWTWYLCAMKIYETLIY